MDSPQKKAYDAKLKKQRKQVLDTKAVAVFLAFVTDNFQASWTLCYAYFYSGSIIDLKFKLFGEVFIS